jgi:hypothetical protein
VRQGKQDWISDDKLMVLSLLEVARYTKVHLKYNALIPGKYPETFGAL